MWARLICRGEHRAKPWSEVNANKANEIARRKVGQIAKDPRLVGSLVGPFLQGAEQWWGNRPARYR